jgi:hypothetical protein
VDSAVAGKFARNGGKSPPDLEKLSCVFSRLSANSRHRRAAEFAANCRGKNRGQQGNCSGRPDGKIDLLRHAEVVIAELVPEAGTVALLGAGLG